MSACFTFIETRSKIGVGLMKSVKRSSHHQPWPGGTFSLGLQHYADPGQRELTEVHQNPGRFPSLRRRPIPRRLGSPARRSQGSYFGGDFTLDVGARNRQLSMACQQPRLVTYREPVGSHEAGDWEGGSEVEGRPRGIDSACSWAECSGNPSSIDEFHPSTVWRLNQPWWRSNSQRTPLTVKLIVISVFC